MTPLNCSGANLWIKSLIILILKITTTSAGIQGKQRDVPLAVVKLTIICDRGFSSLMNYDQDKITAYWHHQIKDLEMIFQTLPSVKMLFRIEAVIILKRTDEQPFIENSRDANGTTYFHEMRKGLEKWIYQNDTISKKGIVILVTATNGHSLFTTNPSGACIIDNELKEFRSLLIIRASTPNFWYQNVDLSAGMARLFGVIDFASPNCNGQGYLTDRYFEIPKNYFFSNCADDQIYQYVISDAGTCLKSSNIPRHTSNKFLEQKVPQTMDEQCQQMNNDTRVIAKKLDNRCVVVDCYLPETLDDQDFGSYWPIYGTPCGKNDGDDKKFCFRGRCLPKGTVIRNVQSGKCLSGSNTFIFDDTLELKHCSKDPTKLDEFMLLDKGELGIYLKIPCTNIKYMYKCATVDESENFLVFDLCPNGNSSKFGWDLVEFDGKNLEFLLCHRDSRKCASYDGNSGVVLNAKLIFTDPAKRWTFHKNDSLTGYIKKKIGNITYLSYYVDQLDSPVYIYVILGLIAAAGVLILLLIRYTISRATNGRKTDGSLAESFFNGNIDSMNPNLDISRQTDVLAYDKRWEFPEDRLKLGKRIGSGAFGIVLEAEAVGILKQETKTTVAVKTLPTRVTVEDLQNLICELKILSHLGSHINVLNLLGACTTNIKNEKLLVILEYCKYGNLRAFLHLHINDFIEEELDDNTPCSVSNKNSLSNDLLRTATGNHMTSSDAVNTLCNYSSNTENKKPNHMQGRDSKKFTTNDIVCWAYQIARGMEYLSSKRVLHGDLAARNCLLAEDNIVKISDFGLSKKLNKAYHYNYKQNTRKKAKLPMKWMAIESLKYGIFSSESDCWSYGVVLWELFTLGRTPYYEVNDPKLLLKYISDGHRMEKPKLATSRIYDMMLQCWRENPEERPSFSALCTGIENILGQELCDQYVQMNLDFQQTVSNNLADKKGISTEMNESCDAKQRNEFLNITTKKFDGYEVPNVATV